MNSERVLDSFGAGTISVSRSHEVTNPVCFLAIKEALFSDLNDEAVILSLKNGKYYGLNAVGVTIWKALQRPASLSEIESTVRLEYEVDPETCHREVTAFVEKMVLEGLIESINE